MYQVLGKLIINLREKFKAETDKKALESATIKLNPDTLKSIKVVAEDIYGNIHTFEIDEVVGLEWNEAEEVED